MHEEVSDLEAMSLIKLQAARKWDMNGNQVSNWNYASH